MSFSYINFFFTGGNFFYIIEDKISCFNNCIISVPCTFCICIVIVDFVTVKFSIYIFVTTGKSCDIITLHTNATAANTLSQARSEAKRILEQAQADADSLKAQAQQECDAMTAAAAQKRTQTEADCKAMVEQAEQEVQQRWQAFDHKANELVDQYRSTDGLPSEET